MSISSLSHFANSFSPFAAPYATRMSRSRTVGLDTLAEGSQYALEQLQLSREAGGVTPNDPTAPLQSSSKDLSLYGDENQGQNDPNLQSALRASLSAGKPSTPRDPLAEARSAIRKNSASAPVRRRISRACDQCNQLRTKCDGQNPCAHCIEFGLTCEYARERKKRGKASKKDLAVAAGTIGSDPSSNGTAANGQTPPDHSSHEVQGRYDPAFDVARTLSAPTQSQLAHGDLSGSMVGVQNGQSHSQAPLGPGIDALQLNHLSAMSESNRPPLSVPDLRSLQMLQSASTTTRSPPASQGLNSGYHDGAYALVNSHESNATSLQQFRLGGHASDQHQQAPFMGLSPQGQSPSWLPLPSPSPANFSSFTMPPFPSLRYPVLQPVLPHIASIIPQSLACDLLDVYFSSFSPSHLSPQSPYVVAYIFRKQSFLHPTEPRVCSPALLASMLWVAAQTSEAAFLTSPPSARGRVCQKLLELTVGLLRPLIHGPAPGEASPNYAANMVINGVALGGFGVSMDQLGAQSSATAAVDDVATYVHLATVVSASEYKSASMRWWTAAWALARELKLGRELPPNPPPPPPADGDPDGDLDANDPAKRNLPSILTSVGSGGGGSGGGGGGNSAVTMTEEGREERRRLWWLLFATDRHLALCYNRPLTLLDTECSGLLQPMNDDLWQAGDFAGANYRSVGPPLECSGHSVFGYFLPLMTILGGIVDLHQAKEHPRFGLGFRASSECERQLLEITRQLDTYGQSLKEFEARFTSSIALETEAALESSHLDHVSPESRSGSHLGSRVHESIVHTKMVVAYGTHIMHVLYILLAGKWDPINLLEDYDLWISSESFISAMSHAVGAAEAAADILEHDPDLSFMPFFFGIYLLQGSFLLLLAADKLQGGASPSVVRACETIVRAHEACVVTLNTEYQRTFRKVMRSALAQVRGRVPEDFGEQQQRRREVLALYRWTGDGSGLAL
ncbi:fungal-specific transcription factor domain-domain-containing protein [Aspergillus taichungensis]|uniref:Xylanolytic transcriptional activator xlnR n=1 Tax=Aspergillus taichungensis TaxID=482145 RepID=A0A2J5HXA3_9EURO|nr:fungal-specific transcription factor domain-domain-containing protein [Aspergillus taichungensis]